MTSQEALQILRQTLVTKPGLTLEQCAAVIAAWNVVAQAVQTKEEEKNSPT